ncbi:hypothetical protein [Sporomusa sphaeroides]|jgi:hypothetical protein|uniref:hypothetical protein n=1 Tax=Sporomusa sphaeroides TaxID=47679 RepID=UPI00117AF30C
MVKTFFCLERYGIKAPAAQHYRTTRAGACGALGKEKIANLVLKEKRSFSLPDYFYLYTQDERTVPARPYTLRDKRGKFALPVPNANIII